MQTSDDPYYVIGDIERRHKHSRATIYRLIAKGLFPKPVKLGLHRSVWLKSEVHAYEAELAAKRHKAA